MSDPVIWIPGEVTRIHADSEVRRYFRVQGRHVLPCTMEMILDSFPTDEWLSHLSDHGWSPILMGFICDTSHPSFDETWLSEPLSVGSLPIA